MLSVSAVSDVKSQRYICTYSKYIEHILFESVDYRLYRYNLRDQLWIEWNDLLDIFIFSSPRCDYFCTASLCRDTNCQQTELNVRSAIEIIPTYVYMYRFLYTCICIDLTVSGLVFCLCWTKNMFKVQSSGFITEWMTVNVLGFFCY
jgi:hypothetical protein